MFFSTQVKVSTQVKEGEVRGLAIPNELLKFIVGRDAREDAEKAL